MFIKLQYASMKRNEELSDDWAVTLWEECEPLEYGGFATSYTVIASAMEDGQAVLLECLATTNELKAVSFLEDYTQHAHEELFAEADRQLGVGYY